MSNKDIKKLQKDLNSFAKEVRIELTRLARAVDEGNDWEECLDDFPGWFKFEDTLVMKNMLSSEMMN